MLARLLPGVRYVLGAIRRVWSRRPRPAWETPEGLLDSFLTFYAASMGATQPGKISSTERASRR